MPMAALAARARQLTCDRQVGDIWEQHSNRREPHCLQPDRRHDVFELA